MVRVHIYGVIRARFILSDTYSGAVHRRVSRVENALGSAAVDSSLPCTHPIPWLMSRSDDIAIAHRLSESYFQERQHLITGKLDILGVIEDEDPPALLGI